MNGLATRLRTGDVIEVDIENDGVSALVLLATDEFLILDPCDDRTPIVVRAEDLGPVRVFTDHQ
jgi:hypothetical protein